ncbi:MAG: hypothetical protein ABL864_11630 [Terricaulis sp.]
MKKFAALAALGLSLMAGAAFADTMQNTFGNTVIVTYANGAVARYQFNADGGFSATTPDGTAVTGIWNLTNGELCLLPQGASLVCTPYAGDKSVGETWTQNGSDGSPISVTLQAGR